MRFVARATGAPDLAVELALAGRAQRAERARGDRRRPRGRRRRRGDRQGARRVQRRRPPLPALRRRRARRRRRVHADRRLRPSPGGDGGDARGGARRAFPGRRLVLAFQPHRYTRTRDLFEDFVRCSRPSTRWCWPTSIRRARRRSSRPTAARSRARCASPGKVEPVFVENDRRAAGRDPRASRATATSCSRWARARSAGARAARVRRAMMMHEPLRFDGAARHARARRAARAHTSWRAGGARRRALRAGRSRRPRGVPAPAARATSR